MARRILNNRPTSTNGRVDEYPVIDIRVLKKAGVLDGTVQEFSYPGYPAGEVRVVKASDRLMGIINGQGEQFIPLSVRPTQFNGRRWYFIDGQGTRSEKLYWVNGLWLSRQAARLTYPSQSSGNLARLFRRREKYDSLLAGSLLKGPARGNRRTQLLSQQADLQDCLDSIGRSFAGQIMASQANRTSRKKASLGRSQRARELLIGDGKRLAPRVVARLKSIVNSAYRTNPNCIDLTWQLTPPTKELYRRVRLGTLLKIGLLEPGKLTGVQIGWPADWFKPATKLFVLIDARAKSPRVIFISEIRKRTKARWFWMQPYLNGFKKMVPQYQCPKTQAFAETVIYSPVAPVCTENLTPDVMVMQIPKGSDVT